MKIKFIGTGSGKTGLKRFHSSFLLEEDRRKILFDAGDSIARALLHANVEFNEIDAIIISHYHADHFAGMASLITQMKLNGRTEPLEVFTHSMHVENLRLFLNTAYMFEEILDFDFRISPFETNEIVKLGSNLEFIARQNSHIVNKYNISIKNIPFISHSFLFRESGGNLYVSSDIGSKEDLQLFDEYKIDAAIIEVTHVNLDATLKFAAEKGISKLFLTHIADEQEEDIIAQIGKISRNKLSVELAYEGLLTEI